jgi:hypothetical protein
MVFGKYDAKHAFIGTGTMLVDQRTRTRMVLPSIGTFYFAHEVP